MNNIDPKLIKELKNGKDPKTLMNSLSDKDKATVNKILSDKNALEEMLKSPQAQAIIKMLSGKDKNG